MQRKSDDGRLLTGASWDEVRADFRWIRPAKFNMASETIEKHVGSRRPAIIFDPGQGEARTLTFEDLSVASNRLANVLRGAGVEQGDRVAILLPTRPEVVVTHAAAWKLGAVSMPLSTLFGPQALIPRLTDGAPAVLCCVAADVDKLVDEVFPALPTPPRLLVVDATGALPDGALDFTAALASASDTIEIVDTNAEDPAFLSFTSGTSGTAKGVLHAHRTLIGHIPGVQMAANMAPQPGDRFWTPSDWAWMGGFMCGVFPSLYFGTPVVTAPRQGRFDPDEAWSIVERHQVRVSHLMPTVLRLMRQSHSGTQSTSLRAVMTGGEALGADVLQWAREALNCVINECYGQTEANMIVSNCGALFDARPGSMGRGVPGHELAVLDDDLQPVGVGGVGELCIRADSPVAFLGYYENKEATDAKVVNGWVRTGDAVSLDDDGYLWFQSRMDDIISSSGYRIGPTEIEQCIGRHPAVKLAAAVGVVDPVRGEAVKAFVELHDASQGSEELKNELKALVRENLAAYLYPREIEFIDTMPVTNTGKLRRSELRQRPSAPSPAS